MSDWTNISPSKPPKYKTSKDDGHSLIRRKVGVDGVRGESPGPSEVFPGGTLISPPVEIGGRVEDASAGVLDSDGTTIGLPESAEVSNRANHVFQGSNYEIIEVMNAGRWYGFLVDSGLGITLHEVPVTFDRDNLINQHLNNPGIQQHYKELGVKMPLVTSKKISLLSTHGVADARQISEILHPQELSLMESLIRQKAFIVTKNAKVIDISAHTWPIDLEKAVDVRARVDGLAQLGKEMGKIVVCYGDTVLFKTASAEKVVPIQDLLPIMKTAKMAYESEKNTWTDTDPIEGTENVYAWVRFNSLERAEYGLTMTEGAYNAPGVDSVGVGESTFDSSTIAPMTDFDEAIKNINDKFIFEEFPMVEVKSEDEWNRLVEVKSAEASPTFEGPGVYDFRDFTKAFASVEEYEKTEMEYWADDTLEFMFQSDEWKEKLAELQAGNPNKTKQAEPREASLDKQAAATTWQLHRLSDAGEEKGWKRFPTEQAMKDFAAAQGWKWKSQPSYLFEGYWVEEDGTSYMPDIESQTGEVNNPTGLTGGQSPILNRGK